MKKIALLLAIVLILSTMLISCGGKGKNGEKSTEQEEDFYYFVLETQELLDELADDIYSCWYDYVYEDKYYSVDGAVAAAKDENEENIETIKKNTNKIENRYKKIRDGKLKEELKAVVRAYSDYYALVMETSGSFESYAKDKETCKKALSSSLHYLYFELD